MIRETVLARSIRVMFVGGLVLGLQAAQAQAPAAADVPAEPEKITVTGSRIRVSTVTEGASPITVVGAADIKSDGVKNTESLLNNLPQVFADQGGSVSNGSTGTATVNLRNLGADRTLVLVNGRRLPQGSPLSTAADLNQVPAGLIKRVEVLTGGAGAVYGSDAVAGVVNFILNDRFEGFQFDANLSGFNHQHGIVEKSAHPGSPLGVGSFDLRPGRRGPGAPAEPGAGPRDAAPGRLGHLRSGYHRADRSRGGRRGRQRRPELTGARIVAPTS